MSDLVSKVALEISGSGVTTKASIKKSNKVIDLIMAQVRADEIRAVQDCTFEEFEQKIDYLRRVRHGR